MDDIHAGIDGSYEIGIVRSRPAMKRKQRSSRSLDGRNPFDVQVLFGLSLSHAPQHAMHVADGRRQDVYAGCLDKGLGLLRRR